MTEISNCRGIVEREYPELLEAFDRLEKKMPRLSREVVRRPGENTLLNELDRDEQRVFILLFIYLSRKAGVIKLDANLIRKYGPGLVILILEKWIRSHVE